MAAQMITKVIVKNLPGQWTLDHLQNFLEVVTTLTLADDGIVLFLDVTHTALLSLEEPVTDSVIKEVQESLTQTPFNGMTLRLEAVQSRTCSLLVSFGDGRLTHDHVFYYFDHPGRSGCGEAKVQYCEMYLEVRLALVHFSLPEGVTGTLAKGHHVLKEGGEVLRIEPWYEQFHRPLLTELLSMTEVKQKPPLAPKPIFTAAHVPKNTPPPLEKPPPDHSDKPPPGHFDKPPPDHFDEMEHLRREMEKLKLENQQLKTGEAEKQEKANNETRTENERLKSENEKLKKQTSLRLLVPAHQLHLLTDFASTPREGCQVTLMEQEEAAVFHGIEEDCEEAKLEFLMRIQKLSDDAILLSDPIFKILETSRGKIYVEDMVQRYPGCSARVQDSRLLCAAVSGEHLQSFQSEFERSVVRKTCKVPPALTRTPQFQALKLRLEQKYMVTLTPPPPPDSEDVELEGVKVDVGEVEREVEQFTSQNRSGHQRFHIPGALQSQACRKWFYRQLDEVKQLILRNGEITKEVEDSGYTLTFQCREEIHAPIREKLNVIKDCIVSVCVDLNKEFPKYSERALVINGLHAVGVRPFCMTLAEKLKGEGIESIGDFKLPHTCTLPQFSLKAGKGDTSHRRPSGSHRGRNRHSESRGFLGQQGGNPPKSSHCARSYPSLPCSVIVGGTTVTIKSGDITEEQVGAAVCVVGQDLGLKGTAIGAAFLKKCPTLAQTLQQTSATRAGVGSGDYHLVTTPTAGSSLPMPLVFHAVLKRLQSPRVKKVVKELVQQSLQLTVQNGQTTVALPPFGVGRRFGFGEYTTASTMAFAIKEFLEASPLDLETISIVVYDARLAGKFAQIITQKLGIPVSTPAAAAAAPVPAPTLSTPVGEEDDNSSDTGDDDDDNNITLEEDEVPDLSDSPKETFEAQICTTDARDCKKVIDILLKQLNTAFLWHETLHRSEQQTLCTLDPLTVQAVLSKASTADVYLSCTDKGLRLCGQKHDVQLLLADIRHMLLVHQRQEKTKVSDRRKRLGLPVDTDHLPRYWKICRKEKEGRVTYDTAMAAWQKRGVKLNPVTAEEKAEVDRLVQATWEANKAGAGADARNLTHSNIQVLKVERLENPELWRSYSHRREQLFSTLEHSPGRASGETFTSVDKLPGSRGAIQTTFNIPRGSLLSQDVYSQVNEHYLFHGTKKDTLQKIIQQGLDFRVASDRTMLGSGVYGAESSTKADQYTDVKQNRTKGQELTMFLMRMLLGEPFIHKEQNPQKFRRPPCRSCSQSSCQCPESKLFDSIIDDVRLFREFVVYDQSVCYPEYIITYSRV
ncbi:hypothetical protein ACOMHN_061247 [Nucella lapillus]